MIDEEMKSELIEYYGSLGVWATPNEEFFVRDEETGQKWFARDYDEAIAIIESYHQPGGTRFEPTGAFVSDGDGGLSREEKFRRQREAIDRFLDRLVEFMARKSPHEIDDGKEAKDFGVRRLNKLGDGELLSKTELEQLQSYYDKMK